MNSEALRLLDEKLDEFELACGAGVSRYSPDEVRRIDSARAELRALLSAQEEHPKPEHWMQAHVEEFVDTRTTDAWKYARDLYRRARELAKQEAK